MLSKPRVLCCIDAIYRFLFEFQRFLKTEWISIKSMSWNSHRLKFIEIAFAYWCSKETEKRYESGCRNLVFEEYLWKISILEPNYLYSYQHKTVVFTVTIRITLFHSLFIKVWKTIFYFNILFMFKVIMRLVLIKALL